MSFKPTLAVAADLDKLVYPVFGSPKLDGIRCTIVEGKALSRTLKQIPNKHIYSQLSRTLFEGLDGELILGDPTSGTVYNETVSAVMRHSGEPIVTYYVFDLHNITGLFQERLTRLRNRVKHLSGQTSFDIQVLDQTLLGDRAELEAYESKCVDDGYEGIILRSPNAPYKHGRSTVSEGFLLKVKRFVDSEAEIIGFEEEMFNGNEAQTNELGRTKRSTAAAGLVGKGTLGAFLVRDVNTGVEFAIGTGLTASDRAAFWADRHLMLGKFRKYKYFPVGVKDKPRHPVDLGPRDPIDF